MKKLRTHLGRSRRCAFGNWKASFSISKKIAQANTGLEWGTITGDPVDIDFIRVKVSAWSFLGSQGQIPAFIYSGVLQCFTDECLSTVRKERIQGRFKNA